MIRRFGEVAYEMELPEGGRIHNIFHVSFLKKALGQRVTTSEDLPPLYEQGVGSSSREDRWCEGKEAKEQGHSRVPCYMKRIYHRRCYLGRISYPAIPWTTNKFSYLSNLGTLQGCAHSRIETKLGKYAKSTLESHWPIILGQDSSRLVHETSQRCSQCIYKWKKAQAISMPNQHEVETILNEINSCHMSWFSLYMGW